MTLCTFAEMDVNEHVIKVTSLTNACHELTTGVRWEPGNLFTVFQRHQFPASFKLASARSYLIFQTFNLEILIDQLSPDVLRQPV